MKHARHVLSTLIATALCIALTSCGSPAPDIKAHVARELQASVLEVTQLASQNKVTEALAALAALQAQLREATAAGNVTSDRQARIRAAIDLVSEDLKALVPPAEPVPEPTTSSDTTSDTPSDGNGEGNQDNSGNSNGNKGNNGNGNNGNGGNGNSGNNGNGNGNNGNGNGSGSTTAPSTPTEATKPAGPSADGASSDETTDRASGGE